MALAAGSRLGAYEVVSLLGEGGMGQVYRARDTRLKRDVALKILPDAFAADPDRVSRFQREAELLATLNHLNIAGIYGFEQADGMRALVLELVEGPTLADRIAQGPVPVDEALLVAGQIASALEAAHERGIIHRDLKPANIKIRSDNTVKVLDFGLAKAFDSTPLSGGELSRSPTMLSPSPTLAGVILGTAAYMSPEQARGRAVDKRTDIWAFGCLLFEMLTGVQPFAGETLTDTIAAVVKNEPAWALLPAGTPRAVRTLIRRCLRKDPHERLHDIADARIEISDAPDDVMGPQRRGIASVERWLWVGASVALLGLVVLTVARAFRPVDSPAEVRLEMTTPSTSDLTSIAISPDRRFVVSIASVDGLPRLWLRALDGTVSRALAGTDGAVYPFWSPNSRSIGFFADGKLKRIDVGGGPAQVLANAAAPRGGAWNTDDTILFAPIPSGPLLRVGASGGTPTSATQFGPNEHGSHRFPYVLPDGRHFLYYWFGTHDSGVYLGELGKPVTRRLVQADSVQGFTDGYLLFTRQGTLLAQPFDLRTFTISGVPVSVADRVALDPNSSTTAGASALPDGTIIYRQTGFGHSRQLVWFDRTGRVLEKAGDAHDGQGVSLSPDGRRVAFQQVVSGATEVWILELGRSVFTRFTSNDVGAGPLSSTGSRAYNYPIWSPDNRYVIFGSNPQGSVDLYRKNADGTGTPELVLSTRVAKNALDWSSDGRFVLYRTAIEAGYDLLAVDVIDRNRPPIPVAQSEFNEREGQFSPDGKWVAYQSNESGRLEIWVQPFPGPGRKLQISSNGGAQVRWRHDGRELFYVAFDERLMAVPIRTSPGSIDADAPVPLFKSNIGGAAPNPFPHQYAVSSDGQRFLMNTVTPEAASPITVILNWSPKP